jgi:hypothetical protein
MKDREVIAKIKKGDESALDFLYKKNFRMMVKMIVRNNGSEEEAKDMFSGRKPLQMKILCLRLKSAPIFIVSVRTSGEKNLKEKKGIPMKRLTDQNIPTRIHWKRSK